MLMINDLLAIAAILAASVHASAPSWRSHHDIIDAESQLRQASSAASGNSARMQRETIFSEENVAERQSAGHDLWWPDLDMPQARRRLQQGSVTITAVATPEELLEAVSDGARHIQITAHLDMSSLPVPTHPLYPDEAPADFFQHAVHLNSSFTNTLTGACNAEVPPALQARITGAPLQPLAPGQCLFLTDIGGIQLLGSGKVWLDNLYLRARYTGRTPAFFQTLLSIGDIESTTLTPLIEEELEGAYLTGIQLQGDNVFERAGEVQSVRGVALAAPTYMSGCSVFHTGGYIEAIWVKSSTVNIVNSSITDNTISATDNFALVFVAEGGLRLQGTQVARNKAPVLLKTAEIEAGVVVSDVPLDFATTLAVNTYYRSDPVYKPAPQTPPAGYTFLDGTESWFLSTTEVFPDRPAPSAAFPAPAPSTETRVATAVELQSAVQLGARHIVVTEHLDLTSLEPVDGGYHLGIIRDTTRSLTGNCSAAAEPQLAVQGAPLVALKPGQCMLLADTELLAVGLGRLWVHNLYLRHKPSQRDSGVSLMYTHSELGGQLWLTGCTMQGSGSYDSDTGARGLYVSGPAYVEGCEFLDLGGSLPAITVLDTAVRIVNSTIRGTYRPSAENGVVTAAAGARVWLQGTPVVGNRAVLPLVTLTAYSEGDGKIYSDRQQTVFHWTLSDELEWLETGQPPLDTSAFLSVHDEWFQGVLAETGKAISSSAAEVPQKLLSSAVRTPQELMDAVGAGARHILVLEHLDFRGQPLPSDSVSHMGYVSTQTHTIVGNCSADAPVAMLGPADSAARLPGQCTIIVDRRLLTLMYGRLWMHNLFIALKSTSRTESISILRSGDNDKTSSGTVPAGGFLWLSRSIVQGETEPGSGSSSTGISVYSKLAANDVHMRKLGGIYAPAYVFGTASFEACSFTDNVIEEDDSGVSYTYSDGSVTWFKNVTFANNTGQRDIVTSSGGRVFSSEPGLVYADHDGFALSAPKPVPLQTVWTSQFLSFSDLWLLTAAEEAGYAINTVQETSSTPGVATPPGAAAPSTATAASPGEPPVNPPAGEGPPPPSPSGPVINTGAITISATGNNMFAPGASSVPAPDATDPAGDAPSRSPPEATAPTTVIDTDGSNLPVPPDGPDVQVLNPGISVASPAGPESGAGGSGSAGVITAAAVSAAVLVAIAAAAAVFVFRKRRQRKKGAVPGNAPYTANEHAPYSMPGQEPPKADVCSAHAYNRDSSGPPPPPPPYVERDGSHTDARPPEPPHMALHPHPVQLAHMHSSPPPSTGPHALQWQQCGYSPPMHNVPTDSAPDVPGPTPGGLLPMPPPMATGLTTTVYSRPTQSTETTAPPLAPAGPSHTVTDATHTLPISAAKEQLQAELCQMYENKERFLQHYRVLEPNERRIGGQGLVQFMSWKHGAEPVAVKFFLARGAYEAEMQLYGEGGLSSMMPQKVADVPAGGARSVRGYVFPPCIVLRKGQSLKDWHDIVRPEVETVFDALSHIAQKLEQLHASGWVHRDLKPGNILRLPHIHSWTLMDFGSADRVGRSLPGASAITTLVYCPPEAALARRDGQSWFEVQEAADMWALGVISFELLTRKKPFLFMNAQDVEERLCGDKPLLWEEDGEATQQILKPLGVLKETVLACLHRDPAQRPRAADVRRAWKRIISNNTTV